MKKEHCLFLPFTLIFCLFSQYGSAQSPEPAKTDTAAGSPQGKNEKEAYFRGGEKAWIQFLSENLDIKKIRKKAPEGTYTAIIQFIIQPDGSVAEVEPLTSIGYGLEEEAIRVIKLSPPWVPAVQEGKKVTVYRKQPVTVQVIKK